jgi:hypothetical protein
MRKRELEHRGEGSQELEHRGERRRVRSERRRENLEMDGGVERGREAYDSDERRERTMGDQRKP